MVVKAADCDEPEYLYGEEEETVELVILTGGPRHGTPSARDPFIGVELTDGSGERPNRWKMSCCFKHFKRQQKATSPYRYPILRFAILNRRDAMHMSMRDYQTRPIWNLSGCSISGIRSDAPILHKIS